MRYDSASLFQFNGRTWAITRGEKYGSYPAEPYGSDISALQYSAEGKSEEQIQRDLASEIKKSEYFRNSLIYSMADGRLRVGTNHPWLTNPFGKRMLELLKLRFSEFVAQEPEYDRRFILASTFQHPTTKQMLYKPKFADFLVDTIVKILSEE